MKNSIAKSETSLLLQEKAEDCKKIQPVTSAVLFSDAKTQKLIHSLEVHRAELEMQNEELKLAKEETEIAAEKYADLYDFAPSGYLTLSREGTIVELNLCAAAMLGKERSRLLKSSLSVFVDSDTKPALGLFLKKVFSSNVKETCELVLSTNTTSPTTVHLTGMVLESGEQCRASMINITERKQAEEALRNVQKLESLGVLAGGIAHDFNNILGGIFGYIDLASEESTNKKVISYLLKAMTSIDRARGLTAQLLTFASGGAPVKKVTHLLPFIKETAQFALSGANVSCSFEMAKSLWPCNIDKNQIGQVIDNLIINAVQAMPSGGTIYLTALNIMLAENEHPLLSEGNYVKIAIKDCGIGIPREIIHRIFDPFFTTKIKGHGLGLATCYSIVNRHGGVIDVESQPGSGSSFYVYLPACAQPVGAVFKKSAIRHHGCGTILVMDDEEAIRETISEMLTSLGYTVVSKNNGKEALDFYSNELKNNRAISAIIFDLTVPGGMGGEKAVIEIRKLNAEVPVFVASGYADDPVVENPSAYGFTASIGKPFSRLELAELLEKYVGKNV